MDVVIESNESSSSSGINFYQKPEIFNDLATLDKSMTKLRKDRPEYFPSDDKEQLVSNYHAIAVEKAEELDSSEMGKLIIEIVTEIDRQGIESFTTFETGEVKLPVSVVSVTTIFEKFFKDKVPQNDLNQEEMLANSEKVAQKRSSVILPGIAIPPVGHPFTPWDYVYSQVFKDLPKLFSAWKKSEPLPQIDVQVLGSPNSHWGEMTPKWVQQIKKEGFAAHGENVANYLKPIVKEKDYVRVTGISMGGPIAIEAMNKLTEDELKKMQFILDNPADQLYSNRVLEFIRNVQIPVGFMADFVQVMARLPYYSKIYSSEGDFLAKLNEEIAQKRKEHGQSGEVPGYDPEQKKLKESAALAEAISLLHQPKAKFDKKVYVMKGVTDLTTTTFGDIMHNLQRSLSKIKRVELLAEKYDIDLLKDKVGGSIGGFRQIGKRKMFTVNNGHQRDNFRVEKWARVLERGIEIQEEKVEEEPVEVSPNQEEIKVPRWKKILNKIFV